MPRVADYSVISDHWVLERDKDTITFFVPSNIDAGSRSVLTFMLHTGTYDKTTLVLRMNGTEVWTWNFPHGERVSFFQEVIPDGVVKPGENVFSFDSSSGVARMVRLSDVVVWWQANI